ncbi:MAG: SDR family oxidoreductase [Rickettsiales bacterium]
MSDLIIITGGNSGIGKALAELFASKEEEVLILGRDEERLKEVKAKYPKNIDYIAGDLTKKSTRDEVTKYVAGYAIKYLIHGASLITPIDKLINITQEQWNMLQDINVTAPVFLTTELSHKLDEARVLFFNSNWGGEVAVENLAAYCTSKAALQMAVESLSIEFPNIHMAMLNPGGVETNMIDNIRNSKLFDMEKWTIKSPEDVAEYSAWILESTNNEDFSSEEWNLSLGK